MLISIKDKFFVLSRIMIFVCKKILSIVIYSETRPDMYHKQVIIAKVVAAFFF